VFAYGDGVICNLQQGYKDLGEISNCEFTAQSTVYTRSCAQQDFIIFSIAFFVFSCGLAWLGLGKGDVPYKDQVCISLCLSFYTYLWCGAKLVESDVFLLVHWADPNLKIRSGEIGSMVQFLSNTPPPHVGHGVHRISV
jgi:hypothetical protein